MAIICPTVTAYDPHEYREQMERIAPFAKQVHIDLMDGEFAPTKSPGLEHVWWPRYIRADIHLMYSQPLNHVEQLKKLNPRLVIIHAEAKADHRQFATELHAENILVGLAVLADTAIEDVYKYLEYFDQVLIFSGKLGYHGGNADLGHLDKVRKVHDKYPNIEVAWDGGINDDNVQQLIDGGVDVLNVGGYVQKSSDPAKAYATLEALAASES